MGRPKVENPVNKQLTIRLDGITEEKLNVYCKNHNISRGEAIRQGIHLLLAKNKKE